MTDAQSELARQMGSTNPPLGLQDPSTLPDDPSDGTIGLSELECKLAQLAACAGRLSGYAEAICDTLVMWTVDTGPAGEDQYSRAIHRHISEIVDLVDKLLDLDPRPPVAKAADIAGELGVEHVLTEDGQ